MSCHRSCSALVWVAAALAACDSDVSPPGEPVEPPAEPMLNLSAIAIGESGDPCSLSGDGAIRCWGGHAARIRLSNGGIADGQPAIVQESGAVAVVLGSLHGCALLEDGTVACWGDNRRAQLGNGSVEESPLPLLVQGIGDAVAIDAAEETTCVVTPRATVECWGGELEELLQGQGPTEVPGLAGVIDVALGSLRGQVYALTSEGQLLTWGSVIGADPRFPELQPGPVIPGAVELDAGQFHLCARTNAGQVLCWGRSNAYGELGRPTSLQRSAEPLLIEDWSDVVALGAGQDHNCVVRADGSVWCWGNNSLYDGEDWQSSAVPVRVDGVWGARSISRGGDGSCAILADTSALCWGDIGLRGVSVPSPIPAPMAAR